MVVGLRFGLHYRQNGAALHSDMIDSMQNENRREAREAIDKILADHEHTDYSVFALTCLASLAMNDDDLAAAEIYLRQALEKETYLRQQRQHALGITQDAALYHAILNTLVQFLIKRGKLEQARALLERPDKGVFAAGEYDELLEDISLLEQYAELRVDTSILQGSTEAEREALNLLCIGGH